MKNWGKRDSLCLKIKKCFLVETLSKTTVRPRREAGRSLFKPEIHGFPNSLSFGHSLIKLFLFSTAGCSLVRTADSERPEPALDEVAGATTYRVSEMKDQDLKYRLIATEAEQVSLQSGERLANVTLLSRANILISRSNVTSLISKSNVILIIRHDTRACYVTVTRATL